MMTARAPQELLQDHALALLHSVDLLTPLRQLQEALAALIEVPAYTRRSDTDFTRQAGAVVALLNARSACLNDAVQRLGARVQQPACLEPDYVP